MATPAERRWKPIIRKARESGMTMSDFARTHGINKNTLAWWSARLRDREDEGFVQVIVDQGAAVPQVGPLRLQLGRVSFEIDQRSDLALLRRVVEALS